MDLSSRAYFLAVVLLVAAQRSFELLLSNRNQRRLLAVGGREFGASHYPVMVVMHAAFLVAAPLEVVLLDRPVTRAVAAASLALVIVAQGLRVAAIVSLGPRWTTRVIVVPGASRLTRGPYRLLRHPNYVAVVVEIVAIPLLHGAYLTAIVFSLLNALMLRTRIREEERALGWASRQPASARPAGFGGA